MTGEKKEEKGVGPTRERSSLPEDTTDVSPSVVGETGPQGSWQVPPPPETRGPAGGGGGSYGRNITLLLIAGIALVAVALIMSSIALGFALADRDGAPGHPGLIGRGMANRFRNGEVRRELKDLANGGQVSIIRGNVAKVEGVNVTIETPTGSETVVFTDNTRFRGPGLAGEKGGASSLKQGQRVTVFAEKTEDGKLEAVAVRVGAEEGTGR